MGLSFEKLDRGGGCTRDARRKETHPLPLSRWRASLSFAFTHLQARGCDRHLHVALVGDLSGCCCGFFGEARVRELCSKTKPSFFPAFFFRNRSRAEQSYPCTGPLRRSMQLLRDPSHPVECISVCNGDRPPGERQRRGAASGCLARVSMMVSSFRFRRRARHRARSLER